MDELILLALLLPFTGRLRKPATAAAFVIALALSIREGYLIASFFFALSLVIFWLLRWPDSKYPLFFLAMFDLVGLLKSSNLLELFIYFELAIYASYFLIFEPKYLKTVYRYFIVNTIGSALMLFAIGVSYFETGSLNYLPHSPLVFFVLGLLIKLGIAPFQDWLVEIYHRVPLSDILFFSAVLTEISPLALLLVVSKPSLPLQAFAMVSMFIANMMLLTEESLKRILALFDASNLAYDLLAIAIASPASRTAALFMMFCHVLVMCFVFTALDTSGSKKIYDLWAPKGLEAPFYASFFALSGLPPFHLFPSKLLLFTSVFSVSHPLSYFLLLNLGLNALASLRVLYSIKGSRELYVQNRVKVLLYVFLAASILLGLFPNKFFELVAAQMRFFNP